MRKKNNFLKKGKNAILLFAFSLLLLGHTGSLQAQVDKPIIKWEKLDLGGGVESINSTPIVSGALNSTGNQVSLELAFTNGNKEFKEGRIKLTLPEWVVVNPNALSTRAGNDPSIVPTLEFDEVGGVFFPIVKLGTVGAGKKVAISLVLNAVCQDKDLSSELRVDVQHNGEQKVSTRRVDVLFRKVEITSRAKQQLYEVTTATGAADVEIIVATNAGSETQRGVAELLVDKRAKISNFNFANHSVTDDKIKKDTVGNAIHYTIVLDSYLAAAAMGSEEEGKQKSLKFKVEGEVCLSAALGLKTYLPEKENSCSSSVGGRATVAFPSGASTPTIVLKEQPRPVNSSDVVLSGADLVCDGETAQTIRTVFENKEGAEAFNMKLRAAATWDNGRITAYGKTHYYQVEGGTKKKFPDANVKLASPGWGWRSKLVNESAWEGKGYLVDLTLPDDVTLPVGKKLTIWNEFYYGGKLYDENSKETEYTTAYWSGGGWQVNMTEARNFCQKLGPVSHSNGVSNDYPFRIQEVPGNLVLEKNIAETKKQVIVTQGAIAAPAGTLVHAVTPKRSMQVLFKREDNFYDIDECWFYADMEGVGANKVKGTKTTDSDGKKIRFNFSETATPATPRSLVYTVKALDTSADREGMLYIGMNQKANGDSMLLSQVSQKVIFIANKVGATLTGMDTERLSFGYKDTNGDGIPDDGSRVSSAANKTNFLTSDSGMIKLSAKIEEIGMKALYFKINKTELEQDKFKFWGEKALVKLNGTSSSLTKTPFIAEDGTYFLRLSQPAGFAEGDIINLDLPFKLNDDIYQIKKINLKAEAFASKEELDPLKAESKKELIGQREETRILSLFGKSQVNVLIDQNYAKSFIDNNGINIDPDSYFGVMHQHTYDSPGELRYIAEPTKFQLRLPKGYEVVNDDVSFKLQSSQYPGLNKTMLVAEKLEKHPQADGGTFYEYDFSKLFMPAGSTSATSGKWLVPAGHFYIRPALKIRATRRTPIGVQQIASQFFFFKNIQHNNTAFANSGNHRYTYTGYGADVQLESPDVAGSGATLPQVKVYDREVRVPIKVRNPSNKIINKLWIHVDGPVKDLKVFKGGTQISTGHGFENRLLAIDPSPTIPSGTVHDVLLTFKLDKTHADANNFSDLRKVTIYPISGFDKNTSAYPNPPTGTNPIVPAQDDHIGTPLSFNLLQTEAKISGSIKSTAEDDGITGGDVYTVTASLDASLSETSVYNAEMDITIPAGQLYQAGTLKFQHNGTALTLAPMMMNTLAAAFDHAATNGIPFKFKANDVLGGAKGLLGYKSGGQPGVLTLVADFIPGCNTNLTGIAFEGVVYGKTFNDKPAEGDAVTVSTQAIYPASVTGSDNFEVNASLAMNVFTANSGTNMLDFELEQNGTHEIKNSAIVAVYMPKWLNVAAGEVILCDGKQIEVKANEIEGNRRKLSLDFPEEKKNQPVSTARVDYSLPLKLDITDAANKADAIANPESLIEVLMLAEVALGGTCTPKLGAVGQDEIKIASVIADDEFKTSVGFPTPLDPFAIGTSGFSGSWYDKDGNKLEDGDTYSGYAAKTYPPGTQYPQQDTIYVSAVYGGTSYGRAPMVINVYSPLDFNLKAGGDRFLCPNGTYDLNDYIDNPTHGLSFEFFEDAAATIPVATPTAYALGTSPVSLHVRSKNGGAYTSATQQMDITLKRTTAITASSPVQPGYDKGDAITLSITPDHTGPITYKWEKKALGETNFVEVGTNATTYDITSAEFSHSGEYKVTITADCGSASSNFIIRVRPDKIVVNEGHENHFDGNTFKFPKDATSINLEDYVEIPEGMILQIYSDAALSVPLSNPISPLPAGKTDYHVRLAFADLPTVASNPIVISSEKRKELVLGAGFNPPTGGVVDGINPDQVNSTEGTPFSVDLPVDGDKLKFEWSKDGKTLPNQTGPDLNIPNPTIADNGTYTVKITDHWGNVVTKTFMMEVLLKADNVVVQRGLYAFFAKNNKLSNGGFEFKSFEWFTMTSPSAVPQIATGNATAQVYTPNDRKRTPLDKILYYQLKVITADGKTYRTEPFKVKDVAEFKVEFSLFPNPATVNNNITFNCKHITDFTGARLEVYSVLGSLKVSMKITSDTETFKLSEPGVYYVKFNSKGLTDAQTLIVK